MPFSVQYETLPEELVIAVEANLGKLAGREWLIFASASANEYSEAWSVSLDTVLTGGALSLCVAGTDAMGNRVVMKIPSDIESGRKEIAALSAWNGLGCPKVVETDARSSVFLMEYLPSAVETIKADDLFILAQALHENIPFSQSDFPDLKENVEMRVNWAVERFSALEFSMHRPDLAIAAQICQKLMDTTRVRTLLHGDFQRKNLLMTPRGLRTLDPYPCFGDPIFDAAFWLALDYHDHPIGDVLYQYPAALESVEFQRFLCWTWAISVIENRPYQKRGAEERQAFIERFRIPAIDAVGNL